MLQALVFAPLTYRFYPKLFPFAVAVPVGFAIHYWLPFRFKEQGWIAISLLGGAVVLGSSGGVVESAGGGFAGAFEIIALVLAIGVVIHRIVASRLAYGLRVALVAAIFTAVVVTGVFFRASVPLPPGFYWVFGMAFMLNVIPYLHDARHAKRPATFLEFARAFFAFPTFRLVAPFLEIQRLGASFYRRDVHVIAQQGLRFIARGAVQFAMYDYFHTRLFYISSVHDSRTPRLVVAHLFYASSFYLKTSGMINVYVGVLNLFGYDMPECYRWFWFAHSPLDYWRRANIYFKDVMTKVVFMPVYFAFRRRSEMAGKVLGMVCVFLGSWAVHIWVMSFFTDLRRPMWRLVVDMPLEAMFWGSLGVISTVNMAIEARADATRKPMARPRLGAIGKAPASGPATRAYRYVVDHIGARPDMHPARAALQIGATQLMMAVLFSLQHAPSVRVWLLTLKFW